MAGHDLNDDCFRTEDVEIKEKILFSDLFISKPVLEGLTANRYIYPSPIQARAIPMLQFGHDLLVQAKSGTGKTLVYIVAILENYKPDVNFPQSLTIVPTREIAVQIEMVLNQVGGGLGNFRAGCFIGGLEVSNDRKNLQNCCAVIGTPGRIKHLIKSNVLNTKHIRTLVLDEADALLSASFRTDINRIVGALPSERLTIVGSATFYNNQERELLKYMSQHFVGVTAKKEAPILQGVRQFVLELPTESDNVRELEMKVQEVCRIFSTVDFNQCLVFVNTVSKAETFCKYLVKGGWPVEPIYGGQEQRTRMKTIDNALNKRVRVLTATDVISRGLDVKHINLVINVDIPKNHAVYLHRIGRGGRFGTIGLAISIAAGEKDMKQLRKILHDIGGVDMFIYRLPAKGRRAVWNDGPYGENFEKVYASTLEQEIHDHGGDGAILDAIKAAVSGDGTSGGKVTVAGEDDGDGNALKQLDDSLERSTSDEETVVEVQSPASVKHEAVKQKNAKENGHPGKANVEHANGVTDSSPATATKEATEISKIDQMVQEAMEQLVIKGDGTSEDEKQKFVSQNGSSLSNGRSSSDDDDDSSSSHSPKPGPSRNGAIKLASAMEGILLARSMSKLKFEDDGGGRSQQTKPTENNGVLAGGDPQMECPQDLDSDDSSSSLSTNVTEKVEVGSDFNAPISRLNQIPDSRCARQIDSVYCSDISDSEANAHDCPPYEVNNDALFAKIMEQKELNVEQQEDQIQLHSIDGCSLEVHDDTISDRELSRKGSVPDVVPSGISLDPSRLHNRTTAEEEEEEEEEIDLNSNTCGSNRGSIFEDEVEDVIQAKIPKRIRFQQQDSLDLNSNTVGSNVGSTPEPPEMIDQHQQLPNPIEANPSVIGQESHEDMDDASSYSSEYDSDGSNSSFFDEVDRESVASKKSSPKEGEDELASIDTDGATGGGSIAAGGEPELPAVGATAASTAAAAAAAAAAGVAAASVVVGPPSYEPDDAQRSHSADRKPAKVSKRNKEATNAYHRNYSTWSNQYWNQFTQINDYVRFSTFARRNVYRSQ